MASFFNRPSYVASWANQRIYPLQEPSFAPPVDSAAIATPSSPPTSSRSLRRTLTSPGSPTATSPVPLSSHTPLSSPRPEAPPPLYFPGPARRASTFDASLPPGHIPSINFASTRQTAIEWAHHPIPLAQECKNWRKWSRVAEIWPALKSDKEVLWDGWPVKFAGRPRPQDARDEEEGGGGRAGSRLSRNLSRRSVATTAADSGVALTPRATLEPQHPLEGLFKARIAELNELVAARLELTRVWMALIEVMLYVWFIALIVALATSKGQQTGYLKGVEVALVLVILLIGLGINAVRMRRWTLSEELRKRTRDWSPLPMLSSTNAGLMRNYLDGDATAPNVASQAPKDRPVLRWRLRETEGSWWLAYRPIIRCELVTPASEYNPLAYLPVVADDLELEEADETDATAARGGSARATDEDAALELPPGYSEA
ncbi:SPOSA6832_01695 [Sporobolomyces salmonicolor]|uniref:SPOSA6832_01695-mRNA-1:cds n=1 Tax=Sporidiobolus salmonicolor TaxID=5005 RepID=A0A0D6EJE5_SPOSA|nr:SPOSA6832_01695 [Sporobolomyces salmonicolor]